MTPQYNVENDKLLGRACIYLLIALLGFLFFYIACYPGYMSPDSMDQYIQSKTQIYSDWHPPIMSWWWWILNFIFPGPQGMLFFHLLLLWGSLGALAIHFRAQKTAGLFLLIGLVPWLSNFEGVLWKDVGLAYTLLAASTVFIMTERKNLFSTVIIIPMLLYAFMVRGNAFFAVIPFFWLLARYLKPDLRFISTAIYTLVLLLIFQSAAYLINYKILHAQKQHPEIFMMVDDLVHISAAVNKNLIPFVDDQTVQLCSKKLNTSLSCIHKIARAESKEYTKENWHQVRSSLWLGAVIKYPRIYLKYRLACFLNFIRNDKKDPFYTTQFGTVDNSWGVVKERNALTTPYESAVKSSIDFLPNFFKPYFWLIWNIIFGFLSLFLVGNKKIILCIRVLILSSLCYILGYFPLVPNPDFRYIYWSILAIHLAVAIFLVSDKVYLKLPFVKSIKSIWRKHNYLLPVILRKSEGFRKGE